MQVPWRPITRPGRPHAGVPPGHSAHHACRRGGQVLCCGCRQAAIVEDAALPAPGQLLLLFSGSPQRPRSLALLSQPCPRLHFRAKHRAANQLPAGGRQAGGSPVVRALLRRDGGGVARQELVLVPQHGSAAAAAPVVQRGGAAGAVAQHAHLRARRADAAVCVSTGTHRQSSTCQLGCTVLMRCINTHSSSPSWTCHCPHRPPLPLAGLSRERRQGRHPAPRAPPRSAAPRRCPAASAAATGCEAGGDGAAARYWGATPSLVPGPLHSAAFPRSLHARTA